MKEEEEEKSANCYGRGQIAISDGRNGRTEGGGEGGHGVVIIYGREQSAALRASRSGNLTR